MRHTKSYMLPKLICLNVLALMMFTFEHSTTADDQLLKTVAVTDSAAAEPSVADSGVLMPVSAAEAAVEPQKTAMVTKSVEVKKEAVYKKRPHHTANVNAQARLMRAGYKSNSPVDCCFRGNRT